MGSTSNRLSTLWQKERLGLLVLISSLIVIFLISIMIFRYQQKEVELEVRAEGIRLVGVLSELKYERLVESRSRGLLELIFSSQGRESNIAYVAVMSYTGQLVAQSSVSGVIIPPMVMPREPVYWQGERRLQLVGSGRAISEFYAPLLEGAVLKGFVRLGYYQYGSTPVWRYLPYIASVILPVFLLVPLFYFLMRREIRPLIKITETLDQLDQRSLQHVEVGINGELGVFVAHLNEFIKRYKQHSELSEVNQLNLEAATKVLAYKRSCLENVLQSLPQGIVVLNNCGIVNFANHKLQNLTGIDSQSVVGEPLQKWCPDPALLDYFSRQGQQLLANHSLEKFKIHLANNQQRSVVVQVFPLPGPRDIKKPSGYVMVFSDNTADTLAQSSRAEFVGHVAHELKTPLNVLSLYSESLIEANLPDRKRIESANIIHSEVSRLAELISNLLNMTKIEMGSLGIDRQRVKLRELLDEAFTVIRQSAANKDLHFQFDVPKEVSPIAVDKSLLRIAINNLLTNAVKYNRPGGEVTLVLEEFDDVVRIVVRDNGIGIDASEQQKIFGKFYRSESDEVRERSGHGLGLALTNDIVQLHHGRLIVNSEPGQGAEFIIELQKQTQLLKYVDAL